MVLILIQPMFFDHFVQLIWERELIISGILVSYQSNYIEYFFSLPSIKWTKWSNFNPPDLEYSSIIIMVGMMELFFHVTMRQIGFQNLTNLILFTRSVESPFLESLQG